MARHKNPSTEELHREQAIYGNLDKDQLQHEQQIMRQLAHAFKLGIQRMEDIIKGGKPGPNDAAAVSAFRAVADVYQAKKRIEDAQTRADTIRTPEARVSERGMLADVLRSFSKKERAAALKAVETGERLEVKDMGLGDL